MTHVLRTYIDDVWGLDWRPKVVIGSQTFSATANGMISFVLIFYILSLGGNIFDFAIFNGLLMICALVFGIISAIVSDRYRRDYMIWVGGTVMLLSLLILTGRSLTNLMLGMIVLGVGNGILNPAMGGWMADITTNENRDSIFSFQFMVQTGFTSIGAILAGSAFFILGDTPDTIYLVMFSAIILFVPTIIVFFIIRDVRHLKRNEVSSIITDKERELQEVSVSISPSLPKHNYKYSSRTPYIMLISQIVIAFGAGLSIPFIPLFLSERYLLNLGSIGYLEGAIALATGVGAISSSLVSKKFGRIKVIVTVQMIATFVLLSLVFHLPLILVVPFLLVRSAFMNMASPLINTVVMSSIGEKVRSTWSMIMQLSWQIMNIIGQLIGSLIILGLTFENSFVITAVLYFLSVLSLLLIKEKIDVHQQMASEDTLSIPSDIDPSSEISDIDPVIT